MKYNDKEFVLFYPETRRYTTPVGIVSTIPQRVIRLAGQVLRDDHRLDAPRCGFGCGAYCTERIEVREGIPYIIRTGEVYWNPGMYAPVSEELHERLKHQAEAMTGEEAGQYEKPAWPIVEVVEAADGDPAGEIEWDNGKRSPVFERAGNLIVTKPD